MSSTTYRSIVLSSLFFMMACSAGAAIDPRTGGTLRVELLRSAVSLDPREWVAGSDEAAANEKIAALVYDRLVALDNYGRFQPQLALDWSHDASFKRWQFTLRPNVKFSDGSLLTSADVSAALKPVLPAGQQVFAAGNIVFIQCAAPAPDLLEQLASSPNFIYRVQSDGTLLGTGPFFLAETASVASAEPPSSSSAATSANAVSSASSAGLNRTTRLRFRANEEAWSGRPFVNAVEVTLAVPPLRQLFDLQLGKADIIEISPEFVRRAIQDNQRIWSSTPATLYALRFDETAPLASSDAALREAISLSLDRQTMANVLLQRQAEPASALLPQWLSGYAFLFTMETDLQRAKEIRGTLPETIAKGTLRLRVDASGDIPRLLGERVAVDARQGLLLVQVANRNAVSRASSATMASNVSTKSAADPPAGVHLFSWHYSSLSPRVELESMIATLHLGDANEAVVSSADPEQVYAREKKLLDERRVLPLVALPEYVGLSARVRDWMPARWGEWHLADVWLDLSKPAAPQADGTSSVNASSSNSASPGAKP
jgi:MarR-like DNA-binding transcriptional regulator SgrR of sgrS sRNA